MAPKIFKHRQVRESLQGRIESSRHWEAMDMHEIDGRPAGDVILVSLPPSGKCRILNIYWDPVSEKAVFEYEDTPIP